MNIMEYNVKITNIYYNKIYPYIIYHLVHDLGCEWEFFSLEDNREYINGTNLDYQYFDRKNPYLRRYNKNKIGLAKDQIENGIIFPFFGQKEENGTIKFLLGKHRFYSLMLYKHLNGSIAKKFLIIYYPTNINEEKQLKIVLPKKDFSAFQHLTFKIEKEKYNVKEINFLYDIIGGITSKFIIGQDDFFSLDILNDEEKFNNFISSEICPISEDDVKNALNEITGLISERNSAPLT